MLLGSISMGWDCGLQCSGSIINEGGDAGGRIS